MLDVATSTSLDLLVLGTEVLLVRFSIEYFFGRNKLLIVRLNMNSMRTTFDRSLVHEVTVRFVHVTVFLRDG